jgi:uncharacterized protein YndB with AHSA1/START domain
MTPSHQTIEMSRDFPVPPHRLFQAYADPRQRQVWCAPSPTARLVIDHSDLRAGGTETARCGAADDLRFTLRLRYHRVVDDRLVCFSEELWDGDSLLTVALVTFDFAPRGSAGTRLGLTDQVTSFAGPDAIAGHRRGYEQALGNLAALLLPA